MIQVYPHRDPLLKNVALWARILMIRARAIFLQLSSTSSDFFPRFHYSWAVIRNVMIMVKCVVPNCNSRSDADVKFFAIPPMIEAGPLGCKERSQVRRRAWLLLINNDDLKDEFQTTSRKICSRHFISGKLFLIYYFDNTRSCFLPLVFFLPSPTRTEIKVSSS